MLTLTNILLLIGTTLTSSLGALALKTAMNRMQKLSFLNVIKSIWVYAGFILYGISLILNVYLLKYLEYSIAFPMTATTYVWTVFISALVFGERITVRKIIAVALIILGTFVIAQ
jgi:drug/metabolite transporter (DMT)-like permease